MSRIELKYVYLNQSLEIVDANREFFVYFNKPGTTIKRLDDFVCPCNQKSLVKYITAKKRQQRYRIFRFKKNLTESKLNIVIPYESRFNNMDTFCLKIIDIDNILKFIRQSNFDDLELSYALSITDDCIFSYQQATNMFKITQFYRNKRTILFAQDIDEWHEDVIREQLVPESQQKKLFDFVEMIKSCPREMNIDFISALRTLNPNVTEALSFSGIRFIDGTEICIVGRIMPATHMSQAKLSKEIIEELQIDPLTKVLNKKTITSYAKNLLGESREEDIALCIVDLDHFKPVNDNYGHMAGDKVLEKTGQILQEIVGDQGVVGRYGGDEFLILQRNMKSEIILRGFLHSIMVKIADAFAGKFDNINITCSIGCAVYPHNGQNYDELFQRADFCLYRAKDKGRNRYVFYRDDLHADLYKKAIEAKKGVNYEDREVKELKFMSDFLLDLNVAPKRAITQILEHMKETYNLNDIEIYMGPELECVYSLGVKKENAPNVSYIKTPGFKFVLDNKYSLRINFLENISPNAQDFKHALEERGIKSTVQCILGTPDNITGLITFNRRRESSQWAEYEVNCVTMFASCFNLLDEKVKKAVTKQ